MNHQGKWNMSINNIWNGMFTRMSFKFICWDFYAIISYRLIIGYWMRKCWLKTVAWLLILVVRFEIWPDPSSRLEQPGLAWRSYRCMLHSHFVSRQRRVSLVPPTTTKNNCSWHRHLSNSTSRFTPRTLGSRSLFWILIYHYLWDLLFEFLRTSMSNQMIQNNCFRNLGFLWVNQRIIPRSMTHE